jgi:hypothetical protein
MSAESIENKKNSPRISEATALFDGIRKEKFKAPSFESETYAETVFLPDE